MKTSAALVTVCLAGWTAGAALAAPPEVGTTMPDFTLESVEGAVETLSRRDGPTVLVFFRGVW